MNQVYVFGHKNPDTDSICSTIAYTELKKKIGMTGARGFRLGKINRETEFVLKYFGVEVPPLLYDIRARVRDLNLYKPSVLQRNDPLRKAWEALKSSKGSRLMPVINELSQIDGVVTMSDITKIFMEETFEDVVKRHDIRFDNLVEILDGVVLGGTYNYEILSGAIHIASALTDYNKLTKMDVVITGTVDEARHYAYDTDCGCIILTGGLTPSDLKRAENAVVSVKYSTLQTVTLLKHAISIESVMSTENIEAFSTDSLVEDITEPLIASPHRNFPIVDRNGTVKGVISRRHLWDFNRKELILIDHNERNQSIEGLEHGKIIEIIDHHRVADIQTDSPLFIRSEPVGCTATIIFKMYQEYSQKIPREIAGLLLSAILSDTLMFRSPTCTIDDKSAAEQLAQLAEVDLNEYGKEMFYVGSSLAEYTPEEILKIDQKQFQFNKYSVAIAQVNTLDFKTIVDKKDSLIEAMDDFVSKNNNDLFLLMITDIIDGGSEVLITGKARELTVKAFDMRHDGRSIYLPGVVSRKKQIVPRLIQASQEV